MSPLKGPYLAIFSAPLRHAPRPQVLVFPVTSLPDSAIQAFGSFGSYMRKLVPPRGQFIPHADDDEAKSPGYQM